MLPSGAELVMLDAQSQGAVGSVAPTAWFGQAVAGGSGSVLSTITPSGRHRRVPLVRLGGGLVGVLLARKLDSIGKGPRVALQQELAGVFHQLVKDGP